MTLRDFLIVLVVALVIIAGARLLNLNVAPSFLESNTSDSPEPFVPLAPGRVVSSNVSTPVFSGLLNDSTIEIQPLYSLNPSGEASLELFVEEICGNGVCGETEDCSTCASDCACSASQNCNSFSVCVEKVFCGDGTCSEGETCCSDCGCNAGQVCDESLNLCLPAASPPSAAVQSATTAFLTRNNNSYTVGEVTDYVYEGVPVKKVRMQCNEDIATGFLDEAYPCDVYLLIDSSGNILDTLVPN